MRPSDDLIKIIYRLVINIFESDDLVFVVDKYF